MHDEKILNSSTQLSALPRPGFSPIFMHHWLPERFHWYDEHMHKDGEPKISAHSWM